MNLMGGRVWVESEPGRGSTFHFTVWMVEEVKALSSGERLPPNALGLRGLPVLVVDDNSTSRAILSEMLRSWSMKPVTVTNGEEAMAELEHAVYYRRAIPSGPHRHAHARRRRFCSAAVPASVKTPEFRAACELSCSRPPTNTSNAIPAARGSSPRSGCQTGKKHRNFLQTIQMVLGVGVRRRFRAISMTTISPPTKLGSGHCAFLLAEDNPVNQMVASERLKRDGHSVLVVENGALAVAAIERETFDIVFLDVHMPEMDGFAALARIREAERGTAKHLPIVALTANAMKGDRERCLVAGFDDYVPKPIRFGDLLAVLERLVQCKRRPPGRTESPSPPAARPY